MATNQPIPFKGAPSGRAGAGEDPQVPGKAEPGAPRPPGEIGGHTVQPWEQDRPTPTISTPTASGTSSKDVPPPSEGAVEAQAPGTGPGMATTQAPYNTPSSKPAGVDSGTGAPGGGDGLDGLDDDEDDGVVADHGTARASRPNRPPVYSPQQGHEPAPRPPPSHVPAGSGLGTEGDRLVEAIVKAIAENIGKAFHQSVAQAVRDVMPLSGKSVDQGVPAKGNGASAVARPAPSGMGKVGTPSFPHASTAAGTAGGKVPAPKGGPLRREATAGAGARRSDAGTGQHGPAVGAGKAPAAPESPGPTGSAPTGAEATAAAGPRPSQFGGTIEAPDQDAIEKAKRADGGPAAAAADEAKRDGDLV